VLSLLLGLGALRPTAAGAQPAPGTAPVPLRRVTAAQFSQLRWLIGTWRGRADGGASFYERYHAVDDSTVQMTGYVDSTLATPRPGDRVQLRGGTVRYENVVASRLDGSGVAFAAPSGRFGFTWARTPTGWTATIRQADATGRDRTTVYRMEPYRPPGTPPSLEQRPVPALLAAMDAGRLSAERLTGEALGRIAAFDRTGPALRSVIAVNPDALARAAALDAARRTGAARGPLHGIPVLLKDNIESADRMATTAGSLALAGNVTGRDAPIVARLRAAGAVVLGKANLSEWSNMRSGDPVGGWSAVGGLTRNPYAPGRAACGSSSGSAVAVAAGFAPLALGTDTNGSITCPAATNGVVGLRPTLGLVSRTHVVPIGSGQDAPGPIARTVHDAALLLCVIAGSDPADAATRDADARREDYVRALRPDALRGRRLGVMRFAMRHHAPAVVAEFARALDTLRAAGAELVEIPAFPTPAGLEAAAGAAIIAEFRTQLDAYLAATPPAVETRSLAALVAFNRAHAAVAGYPHLTVPMGFVDGLPVGLSFIGTAWSDARLLAMGPAFEQRTQARRPPAILASAPP
jgi:Asp-tRNA(Asn)/Glu-tRNA(Gln) amidotransferase A subunit family amidase